MAIKVEKTSGQPARKKVTIAGPLFFNEHPRGQTVNLHKVYWWQHPDKKSFTEGSTTSQSEWERHIETGVAKSQRNWRIVKNRMQKTAGIKDETNTNCDKNSVYWTKNQAAANLLWV